MEEEKGIVTRFLCCRIPQSAFSPHSLNAQEHRLRLWGYKSGQTQVSSRGRSRSKRGSVFSFTREAAPLWEDGASFAETPSTWSETLPLIVYPGFLVFRSTVSFATAVHQGDFPLSRQSLPKPSSASPAPRACRGSAPLHAAGRWLSILANTWFDLFFYQAGLHQNSFISSSSGSLRVCGKEINMDSFITMFCIFILKSRTTDYGEYCRQFYNYSLPFLDLFGFSFFFSCLSVLTGPLICDPRRHHFSGLSCDTAFGKLPDAPKTVLKEQEGACTVSLLPVLRDTGCPKHPSHTAASAQPHC